MRGGMPISVQGHVVGAIGVSADTPEHDEVIAKPGSRGSCHEDRRP
jgi:glc operon protein GlcG